MLAVTVAATMSFRIGMVIGMLLVDRLRWSTPSATAPRRRHLEDVSRVLHWGTADTPRPEDRSRPAPRHLPDGSEPTSRRACCQPRRRLDAGQGAPPA